MNKNLITGLGVLAVAGVAYYFWRRSQLVLAKEKADSNKSVDNNTILETTTNQSEKVAETNTSNTTVSTNPPVGLNTGKKARNFRKIWEGRGGKAKYLELNRDKIAEKLAQAQSQFYGEEKLESPIIKNIIRYPFGRYNSVRMVDDANY